MSEQTAYAQSQQAALALMQSVEKEQTEIEWLQSEYEKGTKDFRTVFDLRKMLWPPENTVEYWKMVTDRMALVYSENKENELCRLFLLALTEYLENVGKKREKRNGVQTETETA